MATKKFPPLLREYMSMIGRQGGRAGRGKPKKRPPGYYKKIGRLGGMAKRVEKVDE